jgi:hypothetical protein
MDLMVRLQGHDPGFAVLGCALRVRWVDDSMGSGEVHHDGDFT